MMKRFCWLFTIVIFVIIMGVSLSDVAAQDEKQTAVPEESTESLEKIFEQTEEGTESLEEMFGEKKTEEEYYRTDRVLLSATKHLMDARKAPAINTVITGDEIRNMGARSIADILRNVPGFAVYQSPGYMINRVSVRGIKTGNSEKILLLIDGHRVNEGYGGMWTYTFSDLMVENIKRLEIVRGPGSALYGTSAFVAVINVITKTADDIGGQQISAAGGSFSTQHYNGLFSHKADNFQISGHLDYYDTDGASSLVEKDAWTGMPGGMAPGDTLEFVEKYDFGIKMKYGDFSLKTRFVDKETGTYVGAGFALNDESVCKYKQFLGDIEYAKSFTDDLDISVRFYGDYYELDQFLEILPNGYTGQDDKGYLGRPMFKNRTYGGEITTNYAMGDHLFTGGINYEYVEQYDVRTFDNFDNPFSNVVDMTEIRNFCKDADRTVMAVYFQYMWEISAYDSLTMGVRYDNYDDFGNTVNPRAGYVHEFSNNLIFKALYGSAFRAPSFSELYIDNNINVKGNPDLDAETITTYEAGLEYPFLKNYTVRVSYFHNEIEDMIKNGPKPSANEPGIYENSTGKTTVDGVEAEFTFEFAKDKYGYINCSYQDGEDNTGQTLFDVPHWLATLGLNYGLSKYLRTNVNVLWSSEHIRSDADRREEIDSGTLVNLTLIAKNFYKGLEIRGSAYNLFDEDYRDPGPQVIPNDLPTNARMFLVEARYKF